MTNQKDVLSDLQYCLSKATAMVDVLDELTAPGGDLKTGAIALDQLKPESLNLVLGVLGGILKEAESLAQDAWPKSEVAHG